jgi:hypothetical protein
MCKQKHGIILSGRRILQPMKPLKALFICSLVVATFFAFSSKTMAIPLLQVYIEGAVYDESVEKWVVDPSSGESVRLWVIGNTAGPGGKGAIQEVTLVAAYAASDSEVQINVAGTLVGQNYGGFSQDPANIPPTAVFSEKKSDGSSPTLSDGSSLPPHGVYGTGTEWQSFSLGDFTKTSDSVADFSGDFPEPLPSNKGGGQINAYEIDVTGTDLVYFDVLGKYGGGNPHPSKAIFAPLSHTGMVGTPEQASTPEPGTMLLLGAGLIGMAAIGRKKFFNK